MTGLDAARDPATLLPTRSPLRADDERRLPSVSIVLPIRNESAFIAKCLDAVLQQDYPPELVEIIVADGESTDGTREIVQSYAQRSPTVRVISNRGRIVPTGLNAAIACAHGDVIVRVDGHCEIAPDYVRRCVHHLLTGVDAVGGPLAPVRTCRCPTGPQPPGTVTFRDARPARR